MTIGFAERSRLIYGVLVLIITFLPHTESATDATTTAAADSDGGTTTAAATTTVTVTTWDGFEDKCYCPGDPLFLVKPDLFTWMIKLKTQGEKGEIPDLVDKLNVFRSPVERLAGVPPLATLRLMFPDQTDEELSSITHEILLQRLNIKTTTTTTTTTTPETTTGAATTANAEAETTAAAAATGESNDETTAADSNSNDATTAADSDVNAATTAADANDNAATTAADTNDNAATTAEATAAPSSGSRRRREVKDQLIKLINRHKRETDTAAARKEGHDMLIPRKIMTGIWPKGDEPRTDPENSEICLCSAPGMRLSIPITIENKVWKPAYADPASQTFLKAKGDFDTQMNQFLAKNKVLMEAGLAGMTVQSIQLVTDNPAEGSEVLNDATIVLETEVTFAADFNETISTALVEHLASSQGQFATPPKALTASCNFTELPAAYPAGEGVEAYLTRLPINNNFELEENQVAHELFGYYKCSAASRFLSDKFDPDKDGLMGIQCVGGEWDMKEAEMPTAEDCVEVTVCSTDSIADKVTTSLLNSPKVNRVAPDEFLFLTCQDPQAYLYSSREPLPAIFKLMCQDDGTFLPWKTDESGNQGLDDTNTWPVCTPPKYCTNFPESPEVPDTTTEEPSDTTPSGSTTTGLPPTSKLIPVSTKVEKVREYDFYEYKCSDPDMVAESDSLFRLECPPSGEFPASQDITWPRCRPSIKCLDPIPDPPFYTGLYSLAEAPKKEYDKIEYTCYDKKLKLSDGASHAEVTCGSDGQYSVPGRWPICQEEGTKPCKCLGDPEVTNPTLCNGNLENCPAAKLLDATCRNFSRTMLYFGDLPMVPLKDRCGTTDIGKLTEENMCYCKEKTEEGSKDAYMIVFHVVSESWNNEMGFASTDMFKELKLKIETNVDRMLLSDPYFTSKQFVRSKMVTVEKGPGYKCKYPPNPPASAGYESVTSALADISVGETFVYKCRQSQYLRSMNSTDPFGIRCLPDRANLVGYYEAPAEETDWEPCVDDPSYIPGCRRVDWPIPKGDLLLGANPDIITIGSKLQFVCPEVENPPADRPNQRGVTSAGASFELACLEGEVLQTAMFWPPCKPPRICQGSSGPDFDQDATGLSRTYSDIYEYETMELTCSDSIKEIPGTGSFTVSCGYNPDPEAEFGSWIRPEKWPACEFKDAESCDPLTEIDIPVETGIIPDTSQFILKDTDGVFKCRNSSLVIYFPDAGQPMGKTINIKCGGDGKFVGFAPEAWPSCRWPTCNTADLPDNRTTGELVPVITGETTPQGQQVAFRCPDGKVVDNGLYEYVGCLVKSDGSGAEYRPPSTWPACREPVICPMADFPTPTQEALDSGLECIAADGSEFQFHACTCKDGFEPDSSPMPYCQKGGLWKPIEVWPLCKEITTTTVVTTTVAETTTTASGVLCPAAEFPQLSEAAVNSGLECAAKDVSEGKSLACTCPSGFKPDATPMPSCETEGKWKTIDSWPLCEESTDTTAAQADATTTAAAAVCKAADFPALSTEATDSGLTCEAKDVAEGESLTCTCQAGLTPNATPMPSCEQGGTWKTMDAWPLCEAEGGNRRKKRMIVSSTEDIMDIYPYDDEEKVRTKRQTSPNLAYVRVYMEIQFAAPSTVTGLKEADLKQKLAEMVIEKDGYLEPDKEDPNYMRIETPVQGETECRDCINVYRPDTCENDLLNLLKTGYAHNKPVVMVDDNKGGQRDSYLVMVGQTVELYCEDVWKKPKKDSWDDDRNDGLLTATCLFNRKFSLPYDISSWGNCLAKCPIEKPVTPEVVKPDTRLIIYSTYMQENEFEELWEGEELAYICTNNSLVINQDPDLLSVKYLCKSDGNYNVPKGTVDDPWPTCDVKPIRPQIKEAIRILTSMVDRNIAYRNALYGGLKKEEMKTDSDIVEMFLGITLPVSLAFVSCIIVLCCCTRPDSVICKICEPTVKEKPTGKSALRRSARSARMSARSTLGDPELGEPPVIEEIEAEANDEENPSVDGESEEPATERTEAEPEEDSEQPEESAEEEAEDGDDDDEEENDENGEEEDDGGDDDDE